MLDAGMRFLFFQAAARVSGSKDPLPIPIGFAARPRSRASYPIGVARSRPRMSESQSIESSPRPCARPPPGSHGDIRTENLPSQRARPKRFAECHKNPTGRSRAELCLCKTPASTIPRSGRIAGEWLPTICRLGRSNGSNVIGRIRTLVSGSDGLRHEPTKAGRLSIRRARPKNARQQGLLKLPLLVYMLSVVRADNARLWWLHATEC